jgi:hypothetical protein
MIERGKRERRADAPDVLGGVDEGDLVLLGRVRGIGLDSFDQLERVIGEGLGEVEALLLRARVGRRRREILRGGREGGDPIRDGLRSRADLRLVLGSGIDQFGSVRGEVL